MQIDVIRKVTTQYSADGADQFAQKTRDAGKAHNEMATAVKSSTNVVSEQEVAIARLQRQMDIMAQSTKQVAAANDNVSKSFADTNMAMQESKSSLIQTAEGVLTAVGHFKLLAVAAYAISPAVRSFTNSGVAAGLSALGSSAGLVSSAFGRIASVAAPALAFLSRISIPITLAVAAFKLLNETITLGSSLLEKYGKAQREMYGQNVLKGYGAGIDGQNVTSSFVGTKAIDDITEKLTRFQNETLTAQQVDYATKLGVRLDEAKQSLGELFKVQINLTDAALRLQNIWVFIVETLAKALTLASQIPDKFAQGANAIGRSSVWDKLNWGMKMPGAMTPEEAIARMNADNGFGPGGTAQVTAEESMALAKKKLAAGMGGGFTGRWSQDVYDLANPPVKEKSSDKTERDAWDRFVDQTVKATAALEANRQTVGLAVDAHEKLKVELQGAAVLERDGVKDTEARRAKLAELAQQAAATARALEQAKVNDKIGFGRGTAFLTPEDVQIANELKGIYGHDIPAALASTEAAALRANQAMSTVSNQISGGLTTALTDVATGTKSAGDAFRSFATVAIRAIEEMIVKLMVVEPLMRSIQSGFGGGLSSLFGGGAAPGNALTSTALPGGGYSAPIGPTLSAIGNVFYGGNVVPFAGGGIVNSPTIFPMANGTGLMGEAGPEAIVPLKRGADGKLGVSGGGGGGNVTLNASINISLPSGANKTDEDQAALVAGQTRRALEGFVNDVIVKQMRPGGILRAA